MRSISMSILSPPQNSSPSSTIIGTPKTPRLSAWAVIQSSTSARAGPLSIGLEHKPQHRRPQP